MVWKHASLPVVVILIALLVAAGCASPSAPQAPASSSSKPSTPASASRAPATASSSPAPSKAANEPPKTLAELAAYQGTDRQKILEEGARKEGQLSRYTTDIGPTIEEHTKGFKEKHPYVQLETFRANAMTLATKISQEAQAGQYVFDVVDASPVATNMLSESKLLVPYYSPALANFPDNLKIPSGSTTAERVVPWVAYIGFGYNTNLIPESAVPKKFEDLLSPALVGKMGIPGSSTTIRRWVGSVLNAMGPEKGRRFLEQLATTQKIMVQELSGAALFDLIAKGEIPASPAVFSLHALQAQSKGGPVKWVPLEPVSMDVFEVGISAKASHPHAALLFVDYLLSKDGMQVYKNNFASPGTDKPGFSTWIPEKGRTVAQQEQDLKLWDTTYKALFMR